MVTGKEFAQQAKSTKYDKVKYEQCDCQGFVERVLYDSGVHKPDGSIYNWKGSNSMWRNALSWKGTIAECKATFGCVPDGAWFFMVSHDGGEVDRGYHDNEGNASHVGIYVGDDNTRDSAGKRGGVGYRPLKDWNMVGLCKYLDYTGENKDNTSKDRYLSIITDIRRMVDELERMIVNDV